MQDSYRNILSRSLAIQEIIAYLKTFYEIYFYSCNSLQISLEITSFLVLLRGTKINLSADLQFKRQVHQ